MTTRADYNDLLMGQGGRSAKFEKVGDVVVGTICRVETRQRTDMDTGQLMTWQDGNPRMQLVIQLLTEEQEDNDDDGIRNLYVPIPSAMQKAIADAVRRSGQHGIGEGGKLGVKYTSTAEPTRRGFNGQKLYTAKYEPPVVSVETDREEEDEPF